MGRKKISLSFAAAVLYAYTYVCKYGGVEKIGLPHAMGSNAVPIGYGMPGS